MDKCELCPVAGEPGPCAARVPLRHEVFCQYIREGRPGYAEHVYKLSKSLEGIDLSVAPPTEIAPAIRPAYTFSTVPEFEGKWPNGPEGYEAPPGDGQIAVVIPTRNRPELIGRAVESVLGQSRKPASVIIVKNGPDHEEAYREALGPFLGDPTLSVLWEPDLGGIAGPINVGLRLADSEYAAVLDDDDEWEPDFVKELVGVLDSDRSLGLAYCDARHPAEGRGGKAYGHAATRSNRDFVEAMKAVNWFGWSQAVWRREVLAPDYLNPEAGGCADRDAWLRIGLRAGVYHVPRLLASHWWHGDNASLDTAWIKTGHQWVEREIKAGRYGTATETVEATGPKPSPEPSPPLPSWPRMAANYVGAQLTAAATGWQEVDAGTKASRLAICEVCIGPDGYFRPSDRRCSHPKCGCYMDVKARFAAMACPIGKWPAVGPGNVGGCGGT